MDFRNSAAPENDPNEVHIWGYVVWNAELRVTNGGCPLCQFSISYKYNWKGKTKLFLFEIVQFGDPAAEVAPFLQAGQYVEVWGRLEQDKWKDNEGKIRSKTKIVATRIEPHDPTEVPPRDDDDIGR